MFTSYVQAVLLLQPHKLLSLSLLSNDFVDDALIQLIPFVHTMFS